MAEKERIAFICARYGTEVNGGAEAYCRQLAEKLTAFYDVTVYTTCAVEYRTWRNEYPAGETEIGGVRVKRYASEKERRHLPFALYSRYVWHAPHTDAQEEKWVDDQGPYCPALIRALREEEGQYRALLFMTYLYYPTVRGILACPEKAVLIPTVHDERPVYLRIYGRVFAAAKAVAWNTPEERAFALGRFPGIRETPGEMTGIGVDLPEGPLPELPEILRGQEYLLYAGRIDPDKGCGEMFEYFQRYKRQRGGSLKLVLIGKPVMPIPEDPDILSLGFVSEEMKFALMRGSLALTLFSAFESLSIVVLESLAMGRPVLVTGKSEVLKGHCGRSGAGYWFDGEADFAEKLERLRAGADPEMGRRGMEYVETNYTWNAVTDRYRRLIAEVSGNT